MLEIFGNWLIDGAGRLVSSTNNAILSPNENNGAGAFKFGTVEIGNGDIVAEQIEFSGTDGVFYKRNSKSKFSY
ncbi:hypothetical protein [Flavobacterium sp.]|uniref:hypothetical protein n=1 Tax=Flavobacterium sp. TaxID=239 RepID=UPI003BE532EA